MDFSFNDDQQDCRASRQQHPRTEVTQSASRRSRRASDNFDRELSAKLAAAGLIGIALPEAHGGAGHGFLESGDRARGGRPTAAPVPYLDRELGGAARSRSSAATSRCSGSCPALSPASSCSRLPSSRTAPIRHHPATTGGAYGDVGARRGEGVRPRRTARRPRARRRRRSTTAGSSSRRGSRRRRDPAAPAHDQRAPRGPARSTAGCRGSDPSAEPTTVTVLRWTIERRRRRCASSRSASAQRHCG